MAKYEDLRADRDALPVLTGRAWVFGDGVSRQQILADEHAQVPGDAQHFAMARLNPAFAPGVKPGDCIVAGVDFAADATQRTIPAVLKSLGLSAVIARSFGHFFLRNAIHVGLPALVIEETAAIKTGDRLRVDVEAHVVANLSSGDRYVIRNLDDDALAILRAGGLVPHTRHKLRDP